MYIIHSYSHSFRTRELRSGRVYDVVFRVTGPDGVTSQKRLSGFATRQNAEKAFVEYVTKFCMLEEDVAPLSVTFAEAAEGYIAYSRAINAPGTTLKRIGYFNVHYLPWFGGHRLASVTGTDVCNWFDSVASSAARDGKGYATRSLRSMWEQLHAFFEWCSSRYPVANPMRGIKRPRLAPAERHLSFWEQEEFERFIKRVEDPCWRALFSLLYYTGLRIGEALALTEDDCRDGKVRVNKSMSEHTLSGAPYEIKATKTGKNRVVPVPARLQKVLETYLEHKRRRGLPQDLLFCTPKGERLPQTTVRRNFARYIQRAGASDIRLHDLRHSYVSLLVHKGANLALVADLIGDTLEQVTNTYAHLYESDRAKVLRMLNS